MNILNIAAALLVCQIAQVSATEAKAPTHQEDPEFVALQERGHTAMGVDQYTSTHMFDSLPDGGRIELQRNADDAAGIAQVRSHLQEIVLAFASGDFSTPAFVHMRAMPGADVMARKKPLIRYEFSPLPRGGQVRIRSADPESVAAIHAFMHAQRGDHRAGGEKGAAHAH